MEEGAGVVQRQALRLKYALGSNMSTISILNDSANALLIAFLVFVLMGLATVIIDTDAKHFEIDIPAIIAVGICLLAIRVLQGANPLNNIMAAIIMLCIAALVHRLYHKGFGFGDYYLFAVMGLCSGLNLILLLVTANIFFAAITSACYSNARGKPLFKSAFPAAIPGVAAASLCLLVQALMPETTTAYIFGMGILEVSLPHVIFPNTAEILLTAISLLTGSFILFLRIIAKAKTI